MTTNIGVARNWADMSTQASKSSNGNMSHSNSVLYSYSTPIANMVDGVDGLPVYLITSEGYGVTTEGKHKNAAHKATRYQAYTVPFLLLDKHVYTGRSMALRLARAYDVAAQHQGNLEHFDAQIREESDRLDRARKYKSLERIQYLQAKRLGYCKAFGLRGV